MLDTNQNPVLFQTFQNIGLGESEQLSAFGCRRGGQQTFNK